MKNLLFTLFLSISAFGSIAQNLICVQSGSNASFYTDVQDAIDNASSGDYIYLPGGSYGSDITIDKELHIVGAGHFPDSSSATNVTYLNGQMYLVSGADGGSLEGVNVEVLRIGSSTSNQDVSNYTFSRVLFNGHTYLGHDQSSSRSYLTIVECVINGTLYGRLSNNVLIKNSVLRFPVYHLGQSTIQNCALLFGPGSSQDVLEDVDQCLFENNVFAFGSAGGGLCDFTSNDNVFRNNLFVVGDFTSSSSACYGAIYEDNIFDIPFSEIFENVPSLNTYDPSYDFHLKPTCPGVGAGSDGTNIGIYGGSFGAKEGFVPYNPHVQVNQIDNQTNGQGNLPVNIKVAAQDR